VRIITKETTLANGKTFESAALDHYGGNEEAKSFEEIFGNLSDCVFSGELELANLNLSSLKGCPYKIINEDFSKRNNFSIETNPFLNSLEGFPIQFKNVSKLYLSYDLFKKLRTLDQSTRESLSHGVNIISPIVIPSSVEESEIIMNMLIVDNFHNNSKNVKLLNPQYKVLKLNQEKVRQQKRIYAKLDYDTEKFIRAVSLL